MKRVAFSNAFNADFKEEKHKRDKDGKFSKSGSGGSSSKSKDGASSKKEAKTETSKAIPPISDDVSLDHINSLMEYTGNSFSVNDGLRKGKLSEKDKKGGVVLEINVPKGTKTANLSGEADINSNNEVILGRDSNIKVSSVTKKGGETYVTVDLVKAQPAPKSEPKGSPPEPVSKVYRKAS